MNTLLISVFVAVVSIVAVIIGVKNKKKALLLSEGIIGLLLIILGVSIFSASMWRSISVGFIVIGSVLDLLMIISLLSVNKRK